MGVGVSSLRLRKALVLRSYNLRKDDMTMEEQFSHLSEIDEDGTVSITIESIKEYLNFNEGPHSRLLSGTGLMGKSVAYSDFIEFLETGRDPAESEAHSPSRRASKIRILKGFPSTGSINKDLPVPGKAATRPHPPGSPEDRASPDTGTLREKHEAALRLAQTLASADYTDSETTGSDSASAKVEKGGGANKQSEGTPEPKGSAENNEGEYDGPEPIIEEQDDDDDDKKDNADISESRDIMLHPDANNPMFRSNSSSSVWRKREVVKHERQVYYTTVDAEGQLQELVEKETSETEVLHMESRETGEFAHRETTVYTQQEMFNDEVVTEKDGQEEYVHLKSQDDEYEHTTSNMPPKGGDGEQPGSPRVGGSGNPHAGDNGDPQEGFAAAAEAQGGVGHIDLSGVDPDHLDDETKAYFCWVLEQQQQEAHARLAAMKQQQDLVEQSRAFDGLEESDLDDETRAYRDYLTNSLKNIGDYLTKDPGDGVRRQMVHLQGMEAMPRDDEGDANGEGAGKGEKDQANHVFTHVPSPTRPTGATAGGESMDDELPTVGEGEGDGEEMLRAAQEALAAAIAAAGADAEAAKLAGQADYDEVVAEDAGVDDDDDDDDDGGEEKGAEAEVEEALSMRDID